MMSGMLERLGRLLDKVFIPLVSTLTGVLLILTQVMLDLVAGSCSLESIGACFSWADSFFGMVFLGSALIWGITQIPIFKMKFQNDRLERDIHQKDQEISGYEDLVTQSRYLAQELLDSTVKNIYFALSLDHQYRISLYIETGEFFQLISRYSKDPELKRPNRPTYPRDEGFIAKAWRQQEFHINDLPDPETDFDAYKERVNEFTDMPADVLQTIRMRSRSYYACAVSDTRDENHVGVLVIESLKADVLTRQLVCECLETQAYRRHLQNMLERTRPWLPNIEYAAEEGL